MHPAAFLVLMLFIRRIEQKKAPIAIREEILV
jgi:hypothetical protein